MITRRHTLAVLAAGSVAAPAVLRAQAPTTWIVYTYVPAATLAATTTTAAKPIAAFQRLMKRPPR